MPASTTTTTVPVEPGCPHISTLSACTVAVGILFWAWRLLGMPIQDICGHELASPIKVGLHAVEDSRLSGYDARIRGIHPVKHECHLSRFGIRLIGSFSRTWNCFLSFILLEWEDFLVLVMEPCQLILGSLTPFFELTVPIIMRNERKPCLPAVGSWVALHDPCIGCVIHAAVNVFLTDAILP